MTTIATRIRPANPLITEECRLRRPLTKAEVARVIFENPQYFSIVQADGYTEEQFWATFDDCEEQCERELKRTLDALDVMAASTARDDELVAEICGRSRAS